MPDGKSIGLVAEDTQLIYLININTGIWSQHSPGKNAAQYISIRSWKPYTNLQLFAFGSFPNQDNFILSGIVFDGDHQNSLVSSNGQLFVQHNSESISVENILTNEITWISNIAAIRFSWRPNSNQLAILHKTVFNQ